MKYLLAIVFLFSFGNGMAQKSDEQQRLDSIAYIDSLKAELQLLFGNYEPLSYADFSTGIGNGYFTPSRAANTTSSSNVYYSLSGAYIHKSGLGISLLSLFVPYKGSMGFYQAAFSPSYDYTRKKHFGFGASYTKYFTRKNGDYFVSPIKNEFYVYGKYKKGFLRPSLALDYSQGSQTDTFRRRPNAPLITVTEKISSFSAIATVDHKETWENVLRKNDQFTFTPSVLLVAANSNYGANYTAGKNTRALTRLAASRNRLTNTKSAQPFAFQSFAILLDSDYSIGKFYLSPQVMFDYTIPKAHSRWVALLSCRFGINF